MKKKGASLVAGSSQAYMNKCTFAIWLPCVLHLNCNVSTYVVPQY